MTRAALLFGIAAVVVLPLAAAADDQHVFMPGSAVKWGPAPPALPKGAQIAVLSGDPGKEGLYVLRLKVPAGYKVPPHTHPADEAVTVLSGAAHFGTGDKIDPKQSETLTAGGYMHMPKGTHHYAWFSEATVLQVHGIGPFAITYINPADDPRKTN